MEYVIDTEIRVFIETNKSIYEEEFDNIEDAQNFYEDVLKKIDRRNGVEQ
jgi:hypothetical protein